MAICRWRSTTSRRSCPRCARWHLALLSCCRHVSSVGFVSRVVGQPPPRDDCHHHHRHHHRHRHCHHHCHHHHRHHHARTVRTKAELARRRMISIAGQAWRLRLLAAGRRLSHRQVCPRQRRRHLRARGAMLTVRMCDFEARTHMHSYGRTHVLYLPRTCRCSPMTKPSERCSTLHGPTVRLYIYMCVCVCV